MVWDYAQLKKLTKGEALPAMIVDLDILDENTKNVAKIAKEAGKKVRVASKSIRVPTLLRRIMEVGGDHFQGVMCFSVAEAALLADEGFDDLLVAYPTLQNLDVFWELTQAGKTVHAMIDSPYHVEAIGNYWRSRAAETTDAAQLNVCIDVDMSYRAMGLHLGAQRSPVRTLEDFKNLLKCLQGQSHLRLSGVMGYEAQIAGVADQNPFAPMRNAVIKMFKKISVKDVSACRKAIFETVEAEGFSLDFFNGGGTGSLHTTTQEPWITEVTVGSGFLQSHLFDHYQTNTNQPAFCFGLQITRQPESGIQTCQSGGFIASGEIGPDKAPIPFLPKGLELIAQEGFGEVQTPLITSKASHALKIGDPVFFRPAKAGEIAERFHSYLLKQGDAIVARVPTYRGMGGCFF